MKLQFTTNNKRITAEFEADTQKEMFSQIAAFQEVFGQEKCGKCGSTNLIFVVRNVDDNEYYELRCADCGARLAFGLNKKGGGLFPKRRDSEGKWLPNNGWGKYNKETGKVE